MKYPLLDPLRGCAALWVFFFHFHFSPWIEGTILEAFARVGHLGVPMFFVISGYCITASARSSLRRGEPWWSFLYRRALRIYPPFWLSILVVATIPFAIEGLSSFKTGVYTLPTTANPNYGYLDYGLFEWFRMATLIQVFGPTSGVENLQYKFTALNAVYWTLAIEVQFYIVAGFAVACRSWFFRVLAFTTILSIPFVFYAPSQIWGVFLPFWPQFGAGCLLYWALESGKSVERVFRAYARVARFFTNVGVFSAFVGCVLTGVDVQPLAFAIGFALILWVNKSSVISKLEEPTVTGVVSGFASKSKRLGTRVIAGLGLISYSLYLLHARLQFLCHQVTRQFLPTGFFLDAATIGLTCGLCYLFYRFCEAPFEIASQAKRGRQEAHLPLPMAENSRKEEHATVS